MGARVWDAYKERADPINQLQDDLERQLKAVLKEKSDCEIVSITVELKDKYPLINSLVEKRKLISELEAESNGDKQEPIKIKLIDIDAKIL